MAKKEETPETQETEETQPTEQETVTPSLEEIRAELESAKEQAERYENLYKDSQRKESKLAERERKLDVLDTIPNLAQRLDSMEEYNAMMADYLEEMRGGQTIEAPTKRSHLEELRQRREQAGKVEKPKAEEPKVDPEDLRASVVAQAIIEDMGWDMDSPAVKKTLHLDDPKKALEILKKEQKAQREREVEERYQAKLKEAGVTTSETGQPSGDAGGWKRKQQQYADGTISTQEYIEAAKQYGKTP
jgi:hypothetical protein